MVNELLRESFSETKVQHLEQMQEKVSRLADYDKDKELSKIRDLLIETRMLSDPNAPVRRTKKTLVEINENITDISPTMQKALNFSEMQPTVVKHFDFQAKDVINYLYGNKDLLFSKIKVIDPKRFKDAQANSDLSEFTHQEIEDSKEEPLGKRVRKMEKEVRSWRPKPEYKGTYTYADFGQAIGLDAETEIDGKPYPNVYLTDGHHNIKAEYDHIEGI